MTAEPSCPFSPSGFPLYNPPVPPAPTTIFIAELPLSIPLVISAIAALPLPPPAEVTPVEEPFPPFPPLTVRLYQSSEEESCLVYYNSKQEENGSYLLS